MHGRPLIQTPVVGGVWLLTGNVEISGSALMFLPSAKKNKNKSRPRKDILYLNGVG